MREDREYRIAWGLCYIFWFPFTFLIVPGMGDPIYLTICIIVCFVMLAASFQSVKHRTLPRPRKVYPHTPRGYKEHEWDSLVLYYRGRCLRCKRRGTPRNPITRDHIIPRIKGGPDILDNLQPLCKSCNSSKKDKTIDYRP